MRKLFVKQVEGDVVSLFGDDHKHLSLVLRAKIGDEVVVCDQSGDNYRCAIEKITLNETLLRVHSVCQPQAEPKIDCRLFFGVLKGDANESTVRHAVELGVARLSPFRSVFSVAKDVRQERLNKISLEAAKQCGRSVVPAVDEVIGFNELIGVLEQERFDLVVFLYEKAAKDIKEFLCERLGCQPDGIRVALIIGSEGGFSELEAEALKMRAVEPLTVGKRILKADTAAIVALSCVMYQSGNFR